MVKQLHIRRRKKRRRSSLIPYILGSSVVFLLLLLFVHLFLIDIFNLRDNLAQEEKQPEFIEITELPVPKEKETKPPKVTKRLAERNREVPEETTRDRFTKQSVNTPPVPPSKPKPEVKPQKQAKKVEKKTEKKPEKKFTKSDITRNKEVASLPEKQLKQEKKTTKKESPNLTAEQFVSEAYKPLTIPQNLRNRQDFRGAPNVNKKEETVNLSTTEFKYLSYFIKMKRQIESVWTYPRESGQRGETGTLLVIFTIKSDGYLDGVQLIRSTGYVRLDNEAVRAINVAAPFAPFPKKWEGLEKLNIRATFEYHTGRLF